MRRIILLASILFIMLPISAKANLIGNPGFENPVYHTGYVQYTSGLWQQDIAQIVTSQNGITPFEGQNMLSFINISPFGPVDGPGNCDVWQFIDLTSYSSDITTGNAVLSGSSYFNRVGNGESSTDDNTSFGMGVYAFSGDFSGFYTQFDQQTYLTYYDSLINTDDDPNTWEQIVLPGIGLPQDTTYLALRIYAHKNMNGSNSDTEFLGNYADDITLDIGTTAPVPEPTTLLLLGTGLMGIAGIRKKFKKS